MQHDTRKLRDYIACIAQCPSNMPTMQMLNNWMSETGQIITDAQELKYYIDLIPLIQKRMLATTKT